MKQSIKKDSARGTLTSSWLLALLLVGFGLCRTQSSEAQTANANISGHIIDSTSALVSDATIALTNTDTQVASGSVSS